MICKCHDILHSLEHLEDFFVSAGVLEPVLLGCGVLTECIITWVCVCVYAHVGACTHSHVYIYEILKKMCDFTLLLLHAWNIFLHINHVTRKMPSSFLSAVVQ